MKAKEVKVEDLTPLYVAEVVKVKPHPLAIFNVLKHVEAVVNDGLQQFVVLLCTPADLGQVGQNVWEQILVVPG